MKCNPVSDDLLRDRRRGWLPVALLILWAAPAGSVAAADAKSVMRDARQSYYNLRNEGFAGFRCNITPNWRALLASQGSFDAAVVERAGQELDRIRFSVAVDALGRSTITHNTIPAENEKALQSLQQIYTGMEQMAGGFFRTWSLFVLNTPLPSAEDEFSLEDLPGQYNVLYKDARAEVATTMDREYAVNRISVKVNGVESVFEPRFLKTEKGYLLSSYQAVINVNSAPEQRTELQVKVDHQLVEGIQVPGKLDISGRFSKEAYQVELTFSDCKVLRRNVVAGRTPTSSKQRRPS
jgi:hypothetical protein